MNVLPSQMESMQRTVAEPADESDAAGRILLSVFELLDRCGIRYCVLHGYEAFPQRVKSDVDCVIDPRVTPGQIFALLQTAAAGIIDSGSPPRTSSSAACWPGRSRRPP